MILRVGDHHPDHTTTNQLYPPLTNGMGWPVLVGSELIKLFDGKCVLRGGQIN